MTVLCVCFPPPPYNLGLPLGVWCLGDVGGGQGGVILTRNIKAKSGVRRRGARGNREIRLMEENERKYRSGAGLHGKHDKKTTGLS